MRELSQAQSGIAQSRKDLTGLLKELEKSPLLTFEVAQNFEDIGSDFTELKLMFAYMIDPFDVYANASVALNNDSNGMQDRTDLRNFSLGVSLEYKANNFITADQSSES